MSQHPLLFNELDSPGEGDSSSSQPSNPRQPRAVATKDKRVPTPRGQPDLEFVDNEWHYIEDNGDPPRADVAELDLFDPTRHGTLRPPRKQQKIVEVPADEFELMAVFDEPSSTFRAVSQLVLMLRQSDEHVKELAADALGNMARNPDSVDDVVAAGAVPALISLLRSHVERVVDEESWKGNGLMNSGNSSSLLSNQPAPHSTALIDIPRCSLSDSRLVLCTCSSHPHPQASCCR